MTLTYFRGTDEPARLLGDDYGRFYLIAETGPSDSRAPVYDVTDWVYREAARRADGDPQKLGSVGVTFVGEPREVKASAAERIRRGPRYDNVLPGAPVRESDGRFLAEAPMPNGEGRRRLDVTDDMSVALDRVAAEQLQPRSVAIYGELVIQWDRLAYRGAAVATRRSLSPSGLHGKAVVQTGDEVAHAGYLRRNC